MYEARSTVVVSQVAGGASPTTSPNPSPVLAVFDNEGVASQLLAELGLDRPPNSLTAEAFLKEHLIVQELDSGSLLQARVRLADTDLAVRACNRLVALAIERNTRVNAEKTLASHELLKSQVDGSRAGLEDIEHRLLDFKTRSQVDLRREEVDALLDARRELVTIDVRIAAEKGRLAAATTELAQRTRLLPSSQLGPNPLSTMPPPRVSSHDPRLQRPISAGTARPQPERGSSPAASGEEAPRTERVPEALLAEQGGRLVDPVYEILDYEVASGRVRLAELESRRRELAGALGLTRPPLRKLAEFYQLESEQGRLEAEYDLASKAYQDAVTRFKQSEWQVPSGDAFRVVDPAVWATRVPRASYAVALALGGALGLGAGLLLAFLADVLREAPPVGA